MMNARPVRSDVRIVKLPEVRAFAQRTTKDADERDRDTRPGRFTIRGGFIDLSQLDEADLGSTAERGI